MQIQLGALHSPLYRRYWLGSLASIGATQLLVLGKGWLVFELSGSPLTLGLLGAAGAIPQILVTLFGGVLADRLDKRKVLMVTSLIISTLLLILAALDFTGVVEVWHVITIAALIGLTSGFDWPARHAFFPSLIDRKHMMSAVALNSVLWQGTRMIMPAIGGIVIAVSSTAVIFLAAAGGFFTMFLVLSSFDIGHRVTQQGKSLHQFVEGLRFIGSSRIFVTLIPLTWIVTFFGVSYTQLMPAFAEILAVGERGFGFLLSASGVGSVTGTIFIVLVQKTRHLGWLILGGADPRAVRLQSRHRLRRHPSERLCHCHLLRVLDEHVQLRVPDLIHDSAADAGTGRPARPCHGNSRNYLLSHLSRGIVRRFRRRRFQCPDSGRRRCFHCDVGRAIGSRHPG